METVSVRWVQLLCSFLLLAISHPHAIRDS
jgi:hypothetical protein